MVNHNNGFYDDSSAAMNIIFVVAFFVAKIPQIQGRNMRYTYIKQQDSTDCAAACLAMVCLHYKKETTITRLRDKMGTDLKGTNMIGLSKCADELGFTSQEVRVDKEGFQSKYTLPAILNVTTKEGLSHFVVLFKFARIKNVDNRLLLRTIVNQCKVETLVLVKRVEQFCQKIYMIEIMDIYK